MGMTIDKAAEVLHVIQAYYNDEMQDGCMVGFDKEDNESVDLAIKIMHKYQKIEEIVKQYKKFGNIDFSMQIISGVIEDGNED